MRAAQYVRMSTEHQQYSIDNQKLAIAEYAERESFEVVATYSDAGKSGLTLARRPGLRSLLADVLSGSHDYTAILVYDVSRWGRFQDADESAYYEFLCKKAGVRVHYCAEPFDSTDETTLATLVKALKRAMAGEYLRELSQKVFIGQVRIARMGFKLGGAPGYGLRRQLVSRDGTPKGILHHHEWKSLDSDRVVYVLGPQEEVEIVRQMFNWFVNEELSSGRIAKRLNELGIKRSPYGRWSQSVVIEMLKHPKYIGTMVYNRISKKLGSKERKNGTHQFVVVPNCVPQIIETKLFYAAQRRLVRPRDLSDQDMLELLICLLREHGALNTDIIDSAPGVPDSHTYLRRFGSIGEAYRLIGYTGADRLVSSGRSLHYLGLVRDQVQHEFVLAFRELGVVAESKDKCISMTDIGCFRVVLATVLLKKKGLCGWHLKILELPLTQRLLITRISEDYGKRLDYLLLDLPVGQKNLFISWEMAVKGHLGDTVAQAAERLQAGLQKQ